MAHGPAATATTTDNITEEEQNLSSEQQIQRERDQALAAELPEGNMLLTLLTSVGGLAYGPLKKRADLINAFKTVNNPHFEHELLKVRDPAKFQKLTRDFELTKQSVEKQRKKHGDKRGYAQAGSGPIKRFKETINFDVFDHKEQAYKLTTAVHNKINAADIKGKIAKTAEIYGLKDAKNITKLTRGLALWQKKNPGEHIDNYFQSFGQKLQYSEQPTKDGFLKRRKKEKETAEKLYSGFDNVRVEAIKANKDQIIAAQREVKELLDPSKPVVSSEELKTRIERTLNPPAPPVTQTPELTLSRPGGESVTTVEPFKQTTDLSIKKGPPSSGGNIQTPSFRPAVISRIPIFSRINLLQSQINEIRQKVFQKLTSQITEKIVTKIATTAAFKAGGFAIKQLLASSIPIVGNIAMGILQLTGLDQKIFGDAIKQLKTITTMAIFAVGVPVTLLILMLFSSPSSTQFPIGASNAYPANQSAMTRDSQNKKLSWNSFEKEFLMTDVQTDQKWTQFENKILVMTAP